MITLDLVEIVQNCPALRLDAEENEVGEDCIGCARHDPDRADLCARMFRGEEVGPDYDDEEIYEPEFDCGFVPGMGCQKAGSEECEFECPYREIYLTTLKR